VSSSDLKPVDYLYMYVHGIYVYVGMYVCMYIYTNFSFSFLRSSDLNPNLKINLMFHDEQYRAFFIVNSKSKKKIF